MQISGVVPILLNIILSEQQSQKQKLPVPKEQQQLPKAVLKTTEALTSETERDSSILPQTRNHDSNHAPLLLPLPLKTPLFPETQFYVYRDYQNQNKERGTKEEETGVAFSLTTHYLGALFFCLTIKEDTINIACHTENDKHAAKLLSHSSELKEQLFEKGFKNVLFRCTVLDPKMKDMIAKLTSPLLLDKRI